MSTPKSKKTYDNPVSSDLVIWEGPTIPCLDLCTGETTSSVISKVGDKICKIVTDIEALQNLDYACLLVELDKVADLQDPDKFSLKLLFQVLLANECKLKDLINSINCSNSTTTNVDLTGLNLSCITQEVINLCGQIPAVLDIKKVLQAIINILCDIQDDVADLLIRIITLEARFDSLGDPLSGGYTEPTIDASCLNPAPYTATGNVPLPMHTHLPQITDAAVCALQTLVGSETDVALAIAAQCLTDYTDNPDIIKNAVNLSQSATNKEIIICDLINRVTSIENTCCSFDCNDIYIGYLNSYNSGTEEFTLDFTFGAGTDIPLVFTDCGAKITVTDWKGIIKIFNIAPGTLVNGASVVLGMAGSGLDLSKPISIKIETCFENSQTGLVCKDCFTGILNAASDLTADTCWTFAIPDTDLPSCSDYKFRYSTIITTFGVITLSNNNTTIGGPPSVVIPTYSVPNNINGIISCPATNDLIFFLNNQSTIYPPVIMLTLSNGINSFDVAITGVLNATCGC